LNPAFVYAVQHVVATGLELRDSDRFGFDGNARNCVEHGRHGTRKRVVLRSSDVDHEIPWSE